MRLRVIICFSIFTLYSFGQSDLQAELERLELEIKNISSEISKIKSQRDQEINAQKRLIDTKQKEENQQQRIVSGINELIEILQSKISEYGANQNQVLAYKELLDKELYKKHLEDKKLVKFNEALKESHSFVYSNYRIVYWSSGLFILNKKGKSRFHKIEFSEKEQKQFNKLVSKEIILPVANDKTSYLYNETGLNERYFDLESQKDDNHNKLAKENAVLNKLESEKDFLLAEKRGLQKKFSDLIEVENQKLNEKKKAVDDVLIQVLNMKRDENKVKLSEQFNAHLKTCKVGGQTWMTKNLRVQYFQNGDTIMYAKDSAEWYFAILNKIPAYTSINWSEDEGWYNETWDCGLYYNIYVLRDPREITPTGWHVPTNEDVKVLRDYFREMDGDDSVIHFSKTGWGHAEKKIECRNCRYWNSSYRSKEACHVCKDTRVQAYQKKSFNGKNLSGFNCYPCAAYPYWDGASNPINEYKVNGAALGWKSRYTNSGEDLYYSDAAIFYYSDGETWEIGKFGNPTSDDFFNRAHVTTNRGWRADPVSGFQIRLIKDD